MATTENNPYQAPASELSVDTETAGDLEVAGKGRRFGTFIVDYICFIVFGGIVGFLIWVVFGSNGQRVLKNTPHFVLGLILITTYYLFFEGIWARTPGKWLFSTKVVTTEGEKPPVGQIFKRTLCRFIPFEVFSFLGKQGGLHDRYSDTQVVRAR